MAIIRGTSLKDRLVGTALRDSILGLGGDDVLLGGADIDILKGGTGIDRLVGGVGNDRLFGETGNDRLEGGLDNDFLDGGKGKDTMIGAAGNDIFIVDNIGDIVRDNAGTDTVRASINFTLGATIEKGTLTGTANLWLTGNTLANTLTGNAGDNTFRPGDDLLRDVINGGSGGSDTVNYAVGTAAFGVLVDLAFNIQNSGRAANDTYVSIENVIGTNFVDAISGDGNDNTLTGLGGGDTLRGAGGDDILLAGDGADDLFGGSGFNFIDVGIDTQTDRVRLDPTGVASISNFNAADGADKISVQSNLFGFITDADFATRLITTTGTPDNTLGTAGLSHFAHQIFSTELFYDADGLGGNAPVLVASSIVFANGIPTAGLGLYFEFF